MPQTPILLLLLLTTTVILCEWTSLHSYNNVAIPAHTYQLEVGQNQRIEGYVSGLVSGYQTVIVKIYPSGVGLLGEDYVQSFSNYQDGWVQFSQHGLQPGIYYLRVEVANLQQSKLTYRIYAQTTYAQIDTTNYFHAGLTNKPVLSLPTNSPTFPAAVRYTQPAGEQATIVVYNRIKNTSYILQQYTSQCLTGSASDWLIIVSDTLAPATGLATIKITLQYDTDLTYCRCYAGQIWIDQISACRMGVNMGLAIGLAIGGVLLIFGGVCLICSKKRRQRQPQANDAPQSAQSLDNMQASQSLTVDEDIPCAICLSNFCNAVLSCQHYFHINCIQMWLRRNMLCPICRTQPYFVLYRNLYQ